MKKAIIIFAALFMLLAGIASVSAKQDQVDAISNGKDTLITGTVYYYNSTTPVGEGVEVKIYCHNEGMDKLFQTIHTESDGTFEVLKNSENCAAGDDVWLVVMGNEGEKTTVVYINDDLNIGTPDGWYGVPEFNTMAMGLAIIGSLVGVVALRRKN